MPDIILLSSEPTALSVADVHYEAPVVSYSAVLDVLCRYLVHRSSITAEACLFSMMLWIHNLSNAVVYEPLQNLERDAEQWDESVILVSDGRA